MRRLRGGRWERVEGFVCTEGNSYYLVDVVRLLLWALRKYNNC